ncbi:MAG: hypothetical protein KGI27_06130 [Thaumarchaeota archaeon]|nr:hypothetical protein [Nitrososphaerota archaeon]
MKPLLLSIIVFLVAGISLFIGENARAMTTPFFGHTLEQDFVKEQLHEHQGWISISSTNSSQDYVGPGQCSPFFNLNMRQGSVAYPHLENLELDLLTPTKIVENQTMPVQIQVTNNENYALYNVTVLDWDANEFFDLGNLSGISILEPHQSKIITGNITFATKDSITCFHYNGGQSNPALGYQVSAKNQTGITMESNYFNSKIAVKMLSPLKQLNSGISPNNVECNQGLQLVIRNGNDKPVCVEANHIGSLYLRGWAVLPVNGQIVYVIKPNTAGKILVNYTNLSPDIDAELNTRLYNGTTGGEIHTENLKITANPGTILHKESLVATYKITSQNDTEIYWLQLDSCAFIPIAVDADQSQITSSDLHFPVSGLRCPVSFLEYKVVGVSNIAAAYKDG